VRNLRRTGRPTQSIGLAFAVIAGLALVGLPLTIRNYRSVYRCQSNPVSVRSRIARSCSRS
jgi:hypothetical protein